MHPRLAGIQYALITHTLQHTANLFDPQISTVVYQETLQALTEPGHEDFFGGGVVERVRQALSFAGQGSEGSAVS